jgi:hypothetical protein
LPDFLGTFVYWLAYADAVYLLVCVTSFASGSMIALYRRIRERRRVAFGVSVTILIIEGMLIFLAVDLVESIFVKAVMAYPLWAGAFSLHAGGFLLAWYCITKPAKPSWIPMASLWLLGFVMMAIAQILTPLPSWAYVQVLH